MQQTASSQAKPDAKNPHHARHWIMAYDISNNRRRRQLARLLEGHAQRIQRSVFSTVCTQHEMVKLLQRAQASISAGDRMVAWPVVKHAALEKPWQHIQKQSSLPAYWVV